MIQKAVESSYAVLDELDARDEAWNVYTYMLKLGSATISELALNMNLHHFDSIDAPLYRIVFATSKSLSLNKKVTSKDSRYGHFPFGYPARLCVVMSEISTIIEHAVHSRQQARTEDLPMSNTALKVSCIVDYAIRAVDNKGEKLPHETMVNAITIVMDASFVAAVQSDHIPGDVGPALAGPALAGTDRQWD